MTVYAVHTTDTGQLVSVGTVVADPLPAGLTATALSAGDGQALRDGTGTWDAATRAVIPAPVDPTVANLATIESGVTQHLADLATIANSSGTLTGAQLSNAVRVLARGQRRIVRVLHNRLDAAD
jgi:hypothetical protein